MPARPELCECHRHGYSSHAISSNYRQKEQIYLPPLSFRIRRNIFAALTGPFYVRSHAEICRRPDGPVRYLTRTEIFLAGNAHSLCRRQPASSSALRRSVNQIQVSGLSASVPEDGQSARSSASGGIAGATALHLAFRLNKIPRICPHTCHAPGVMTAVASASKARHILSTIEILSYVLRCISSVGRDHIGIDSLFLHQRTQPLRFYHDHDVLPFCAAYFIPRIKCYLFLVVLFSLP